MLLEFADKTGKKPKCVKGYPCGGGCINRKRNCKKPLEGQADTFANWLKLSGEKAAPKSNKKKSIVEPKIALKKKALPKIEALPKQEVLVESKPKPPAKTATTSGFASIDKGFPEDSRKNRRLNNKVEKEINTLIKDANKRVKKNPDLYSVNRDIVFDTRTAHQLNPEGTRVARSESGKIEAVANFQDRDDSVYIDYLATAPKNVDRNDPDYSRGSGTKMVVEAVKESMSKNKNGVVTLSAIDGAKSFYEKLGFTSTGRADDDLTTSMKLSAKNAKKLLEKTLNFAEMTFEDELELLELKAKGAFARGTSKSKNRVKKRNA